MLLNKANLKSFSHSLAILILLYYYISEIQIMEDSNLYYISQEKSFQNALFVHFIPKFQITQANPMEIAYQYKFLYSILLNYSNSSKIVSFSFFQKIISLSIAFFIHYIFFFIHIINLSNLKYQSIKYALFFYPQVMKNLNQDIHLPT